MTISLVSAPVIGFDLVRHPAGPAIAETLVWAIGLGPRDLPLFSATHAVREPAWHQVRQVRDRLGTGALNGSALAPVEPVADGGSLQAMIVGLRRSLIADLDDLEHLIRADVLAWAAKPAETSDAFEVADVEAAIGSVLAAVAADWVDGVDADTRQQLAAPASAVRHQTDAREPDVGPCEAQVREALGILGGLDADGRHRLREVNTLLGPGGSTWAQAMHEASWAALTTGRIRAAATAQFLAAQAFLAGGLDAADGAEGVWNLVSGHLHALVVGDVLGSALQVTLSRGWRAALQPN
ncbi:MAG TPA: hypothetical protein VMB79_10195 [Jatrophihabitans sp.]|nr:hypothetical protein [Jatrophihabitans sp.]